MLHTNQWGCREDLWTQYYHEGKKLLQVTASEHVAKALLLRPSTLQHGSFTQHPLFKTSWCGSSAKKWTKQHTNVKILKHLLWRINLDSAKHPENNPRASGRLTSADREVLKAVEKFLTGAAPLWPPVACLALLRFSFNSGLSLAYLQCAFILTFCKNTPDASEIST